MTLAADFPTYELAAHRDIYRIHRQPPWWFSSDGSGRFDPVGTGMGACYLAGAGLGAWVEVFRNPGLLLPQAEVDARRLLTVACADPLVLADLTSRLALRHDVTASLGADEDYARSQAFAVEAVQSGYAGLRYFVRHDNSQKLVGYALFHQAGDHPDWTGFDHATSAAIPQDLIDEARAEFGYRIVPTP